MASMMRRVSASTLRYFSFTGGPTRMRTVGGSVMLRVWDAATGEPIGELLTGYTGVTAVAVGRAGTREIIVATLDNRMVQVWDALTLQPVGYPVSGHSGHGPPVDGVAVGDLGDLADGWVPGRAVAPAAGGHGDEEEQEDPAHRSDPTKGV